MRRLELALACLVASAAACFIASSDDTVAEDGDEGLERLLEELSFDAGKAGLEQVEVDAAYVDARLETLSQREDLARYVL